MSKTHPMPVSTRRLQLGRLCRWLAVPVLASASVLCPAQTPAETKAVAKIKADCRVEGEASGLAGADLEEFVDQCVADLLSVEIHNIRNGE